MAEVRVVEPDDWELWRDLRLRSLADTPDAFGATLEQELTYDEEEWRRRLEARRALVVFADGEPAAMGGAFVPEDGRFHIVAMWVIPEHRGRGYSKLALEALVAKGRAEGRLICLDVTQGNSLARAAYEGFGFVPSGEPPSPLREGSELLVDHLVLPD